MDEALLHVKDRSGERTLRLDVETILRLLAAVRDDTDSFEELVQEARRYDASLSPERVRRARQDNDRPQAPFRLDVVQRVIAFPAGDVRLGRRGVLQYRDEAGKFRENEYRTYELGRGFRLVDSDGNRALDEKATLRSEKALWAAALPPDVEAAGDYRIDGVDLGAASLRDVYLWTLTEDAREPTVNGRSVYGFRMEGPSRAVVEGQTRDQADRGQGGNR